MSRYIYDNRTVNSSRKTKWCDSCGVTIQKGESSITVTYFDGAEFAAAHVCSDKCLEQYTKDFNNEEE